MINFDSELSHGYVDKELIYNYVEGNHEKWWRLSGYKIINGSRILKLPRIHEVEFDRYNSDFTEVFQVIFISLYLVYMKMSLV